MPVYDVVERHRTVVRAPPTHVFAALREADLTGGPLTRALLAVRAIPAAALALVRSPRAALAELRARRTQRGGARLADLERAGFRVVAERAPHEVVLGVLGKFWTLRGGLRPEVSRAHFDAGPPPGHALAAWSFTATPRSDGATELRTETRVLCAPDVRLRFRAYWLLVRPGSGLIRKDMLRAIRRAAERRQAADS